MQDHVMEPPSRRLLLGAARTVVAVPAAVGGCWLGLRAGEMLVHAVAGLTGCSIAQLKDMLVWSSLSGGVMGAVAAIWLTLLLTRAGRLSQRLALAALGIALLQGAAMMLISFYTRLG
jgi:hypothetical protein